MEPPVVRTGLFVGWCPKDALDGMQALDIYEELGYRRIIDFIYNTNDRLLDDDKRMVRLTKLGKRWPRVKAALINLGKIYIQDGYIRNKRCSQVLCKIDIKRAQQSEAGKKGMRKRYLLKNNNFNVTNAATNAQRTDNLTDEPINHKLIIEQTNKLDQSPKAPPASDNGWKSASDLEKAQTQAKIIDCLGFGNGQASEFLSYYDKIEDPSADLTDAAMRCRTYLGQEIPNDFDKKG